MFILLGTAAVLGVEYVRGRDALMQEAMQRLAARDRLVVNRLEDALRARYQLVSLWPELESSQDFTIDDLDKRLAASLVQLASSFRAGDAAFGVAPTGRVVAASDPARIGGTVSGEPWFDEGTGLPRDATALRLVVGTAGLTLVASSPVHARTTGRLLGWIALVTPWSTMLDQVAGTDRNVLVVRGGDGGVIGRPAIDVSDSTRYLWTHVKTASIGGLSLDADMALPLADALRPLKETGLQLGVFALVVLALTLPALLALVRSTTAELSRLTTSARAIRGGSAGGLSVSSAAPREVRVLADALETMVGRLEESRQELARQESLAAMGTMAAGLAHEIRTPLSVLRGSAEMLAKRVAPDSREAELVSFLLQDVDRLGRLVDDLLVFARPRRPDLARVDLAAVAGRAAKGLSPRLGQDGLTLDLELQPASLIGDAEQLYQVVLNLLSNAARASQAGQSLWLTTGVDDGRAVLRVRDAGKGIPADQLDHIWDPFFTTGNGGTGLGLPIVRRIVQEHGGHISVESQAGVGTEVTVSLPSEWMPS